MKNRIRNIDVMRIMLFSVVFIIIGIIASILRHNYLYLLLFTTIGLSSSLIELLKMLFPNHRQKIRLSFQLILGTFFLSALTYGAGVNFQFPQIFFDASKGVITGALIQLIIARIIIPFFYGNIFCSQVCWNGMAFEMMKKSNNRAGKIKSRSKLLSWSYLSLIIITILIVAQWWNPATNGIDIQTNLVARRVIAFGEITFIFIFSLLLIPFWGSRAYCRTFCPFITISGIFSKFSLYKIRPITDKDCINCKECDLVCQMNIAVSEKILKNRPISDPNCIMCERCVDVCPQSCLSMSPFSRR